jgi:hypothetical protein
MIVVSCSCCRLVEHGNRKTSNEVSDVDETALPRLAPLVLTIVTLAVAGVVLAWASVLPVERIGLFSYSIPTHNLLRHKNAELWCAFLSVVFVALMAVELTARIALRRLSRRSK